MGPNPTTAEKEAAAIAIKNIMYVHTTLADHFHAHPLQLCMCS